jgi:hypothetical protein
MEKEDSEPAEPYFCLGARVIWHVMSKSISKSDGVIAAALLYPVASEITMASVIPLFL